MRLLLDTNTLNFVLRERAPVLRKFTEALAAGTAFVSSDVVDYEIRRYLWAEIHRRGRSIEDRDLLIAISALKEQATIVTNNTRHFLGLSVPVVDWTVE